MEEAGEIGGHGIRVEGGQTSSGAGDVDQCRCNLADFVALKKESTALADKGSQEVGS